MKDKYTPIHNEVLEALCRMNLSPYETRVLFVIWRKTYGFRDSTGNRKKEDWISGTQFTEITGLDRRLISRALKGLETKQIIKRTNSVISFSKEFYKNKSKVVISRDDKTPPKVVISRDDSLSSILLPAVISRDDTLSSVEMHTKENITKETLQKKKETPIYTPPNEIAEIVEHWNTKVHTIHHRTITPKAIGSINTKIKEKYSIDEIKTAIDNLDIILIGSKQIPPIYFFKYDRWTLWEFLQRGFYKFLDLEKAKNSFRNQPIEKPNAAGLTNTGCNLFQTDKSRYAKYE